MFSQNLDVFMFFFYKTQHHGEASEAYKYSINFKKDVVEYAKEHSVNSTADKFGVHRKSVQGVKKNKPTHFDKLQKTC